MLTVVTIFFLIGCEADPRVTYFNLRRVDDDALGILREMEASDMDFWLGTSFGVSALDLELAPDENYYGVIELVDHADYLVAQVENIASEDFHFVLKMFINYEEVAFRVKGEEDYATEFVFLLESGYEVDIPFTLQLDLSDVDVTYKLTAGIFADPDREVMNEENLDHFWRSGGMVLNNDLILGSRSDLDFERTSNVTILSREEDTSFFAFFVAPEFRRTDYGFLAHPEFTMQARRGEEIELLFYASPFASFDYDLEDYIIIGMLNWQQIPLNGDPFLFIDVGATEFENILDHGRFVLEGIDEVGYYDFVLFLVPHPAYRNSLNNSFPLQLSNRMIIEIVE